MNKRKDDEERKRRESFDAGTSTIIGLSVVNAVALIAVIVAVILIVRYLRKKEPLTHFDEMVQRSRTHHAITGTKKAHSQIAKLRGANDRLASDVSGLQRNNALNILNTIRETHKSMADMAGQKSVLETRIQSRRS